MRDLHVADVGDFGKFGLLRQLVGQPGLGRQLKLGVVWYYWGESAFSYIDPPDPASPLAQIDGPLYQELAGIGELRTSLVTRLEQTGLLPQNTVYFRDTLPNGQARVDWLARAMGAVEQCDVIFLDPDVGLKQNGNRKYARFSEAAEFWAGGHSLVIYQDVSHQSVEDRMERLCKEIRDELQGSAPTALRYHHGGSRIFFIIPNPADDEVAQLLWDRVDALLTSPWGTGRNPHFTRVDC